MGLWSGCSWHQNKFPGFAAMSSKTGAKFLFHLKKLEFILTQFKTEWAFPIIKPVQAYYRKVGKGRVLISELHRA